MVSPAHSPPFLRRLHSAAARAWLAVAVGAGCGFVARDVLDLSPRWVAVAWAGGAAAALLPAFARRRDGGPPHPMSRQPSERSGGRSDESGQATVEWIALLLVTALAMTALGSLASQGGFANRLGFATRGDGWSFAGFLAHRFVCAVKGCDDGDRQLARAYGDRDAALVRQNAPSLVYETGERQLPVDWRRCRERHCAEVSGERGLGFASDDDFDADSGNLDLHRSAAGPRATVFTRVLRRHGRTYVQYWLFYPDSNTAVAGSDKLWELAWLVPRLTGLVRRAPPYPGFHRDDWEGYAIRIDPDGSAWVRASAHGNWSGWSPRDGGWLRVERGSHAGRLPQPRQHEPTEGYESGERATTSEGLRLIPLETLDIGRYRPHSDRVKPPWRKRVYSDPESPES